MKPKVYILTTCPRCRAVKQYLDDIHLDYDVVKVDLLPYVERQQVVQYLRKYQQVVAFPVIEAGDIVLVGSNVDEVKTVFKGEDK